MYMTAAPAHRAKAVKTAIDDMSAAGHFWHPLEQLERVTVEPLPDFEDFLEAWDHLVRILAERERDNEWDTDVDRWRREVTQRLEGTDGLAAIARSTKRSDDFRAWCRALVEGKDWTGALIAYTESAESVEDKSYARGDFLDGAALAAQELSRKDLPLKAMQKAAEKRLDGVTEHKRRRYYGHAASLAASCMAVDEANNSSKWFAAIRDEYRRYPALQRELNWYGGGQ